MEEKIKSLLLQYEDGVILMDGLVLGLIELDKNNETWIEKIKETVWSYLTGDYDKLDSDLSPLL